MEDLDIWIQGRIYSFLSDKDLFQFRLVNSYYYQLSNTFSLLLLREKYVGKIQLPILSVSYFQILTFLDKISKRIFPFVLRDLLHQQGNENVLFYFLWGKLFQHLDYLKIIYAVRKDSSIFPLSRDIITNNNLFYLEWIYSIDKSLISSRIANISYLKNELEIMWWLEDLSPPVLIDRKIIRKLFKQLLDDILSEEELRRQLNTFPFIPDDDDLSLLIGSEKLTPSLLDYLYSKESYFSEEQYNDFLSPELMEFVQSKKLKYNFTQNGLRSLIEAGNSQAVLDIYEQTGFHPDEETLQFAIFQGNLFLTDWIINEFHIYPTPEMISGSAYTSDVEMLKFFLSLPPPSSSSLSPSSPSSFSLPPSSSPSFLPSIEVLSTIVERGYDLSILYLNTLHDHALEKMEVHPQWSTDCLRFIARIAYHKYYAIYVDWSATIIAEMRKLEIPFV
jgi:hypothetical protein